MQGMQLFEKLFHEMNTCLPEEFNSRFGNSNLSEIITKIEWELFDVLHEPTKDEFWETVSHYPWLLDLISPCGEIRVYSWSKLIPLFPTDVRVLMVKPLDLDSFRIILELFVWFFYASAESVIEIDFKSKKGLVLSRKIGNKKNLSITSQIKTQFGKAEDISLNLYLSDIGNIPLLKGGEEVELSTRIKLGDKEALKQMVSANLRFVVSVAKQYQNQGVSISDLIAEGNIGLIKAAKRFDHTRGFKFISYAVWWIRQSILYSLSETSRVVRLPLNRSGTIFKIRKSIRILQQTLGHNPSTEEIAEQLGLSEKEVISTMKISNSALSLDASFEDAEDNSLYDVLEDEDAPPPYISSLMTSLQTEISSVLDTLKPREAEVMELYFGLNGHQKLTLDEIGARFSLTRERIRQVKEGALRRLRHSSRSMRLKGYFTEEFSDNV